MTIYLIQNIFIGTNNLLLFFPVSWITVQLSGSRTWIQEKTKRLFLSIVLPFVQMPNSADLDWKHTHTHLQDCISVAMEMRSDSWQTAGNWSRIFSLWCQTQRWTVNRVLLLPQGVDRGSQRTAPQPGAYLISDASIWGKEQSQFLMPCVAMVTAERVKSGPLGWGLCAMCVES